MDRNSENDFLLNKSVDDDSILDSQHMSENNEESILISGKEEKEAEDILEKDIQEGEELKKFIQLKDNVSWLNASNIFFTFFVGISQMVFFDICLVYLLKSEDYFDLDEDKVAK